MVISKIYRHAARDIFFGSVGIYIGNIIDGIFISKFLGETYLAAMQLVTPVLIGIGIIAALFQTGRICSMREASVREKSIRQIRHFPLRLFL